MAVQKQDDQREHTFSNYVRIRDVVLKTYLGRWMIGRSGERGSGISVLPAWHDDDDIFYTYSIQYSVWYSIHTIFYAYNILYTIFYTYSVYTHFIRGCPRGVMVKAMDCGIVVHEFVLLSRYYVHFRLNKPWERYESPYPPSYGLNSTTTVLLGEWLWH